MLRRPIFLFLFFAVLYNGYQCPFNLQTICQCSTNHFGTSVTCTAGKSLEDVLKALSIFQAPIDELVIADTPIDLIPDFAFRNLSSRKISLSGNGLTTIYGNAFAGPLVDSLQELEITNNKLSTVVHQGISMLRNLHILNLRNNSIASLPANAFLSYKSRFNLKVLDLSANQLSQIPNHAFSGFEKLEFLKINKNGLKTIPTDALKALPSLESLLLAVNEIKNITADALPLPNLKRLSLEANLISEISVDAFRQNQQLSSLSLNDNQLNRIEPIIFQPISQLNILNLGSNKLLTTITNNALKYLELLFRLDFSDCSISTIESGAFQRLQQLQIINLSGNHLKQIDQIFSGLQHLTTIDLNGNKITEVKNFAFSNLSSLNHLDLSNNQLTTLPESSLYGTLRTTWPSTARDFYLYDNPWNCNQDLLWLKKWLNENENVQITAPGHQPTKCHEPPGLSGADIRNATFPAQHSENSYPPSKTTPGEPKPENNRNSNDVNLQLASETTKQPASSTSFNLLFENNPEIRQPAPPYPRKTTIYARGDPYDTMLLLKTTTSHEGRQLDDADEEETKASTVALVILLVLSGVGICGIVLLVIWYTMKRRGRRGDRIERGVSNSTVSGACSTHGFGIYKKDPWFRKEYRRQKRSKSFLKMTFERWF